MLVIWRKNEEEKLMKEYNIALAGVGGQGLLMLIKIIDDAAMLQGYDLKSSELHGLAQRGGSITGHIRFGKKIYSSLIMEGEANIIIGLEPLETLRSCFYGSRTNKTIFIINNKKIAHPTEKDYPELEKILFNTKKFSSKQIVLNASDVAKEVGGSEMMSNIYMLGYASRFIPLKKENMLKAMEMNIKPKYIEINKKLFEMGAEA